MIVACGVTIPFGFESSRFSASPALGEQGARHTGANVLHIKRGPGAREAGQGYRPEIPGRGEYMDGFTTE